MPGVTPAEKLNGTRFIFGATILCARLCPIHIFGWFNALDTVPSNTVPECLVSRVSGVHASDIAPILRAGPPQDLNASP